MTSMLERAARSVNEATYGEFSPCRCLAIARAVLMAVREPDEAVFDRANEALFDAGEPVAHKAVHLAMIDAILKESE